VGSGEILLIMVIALVVLGPEKLPKLAADIGRWMGRARAMARQLRTQLDQEIQVAEMLREQKRTAQTDTAASPLPPPAALPPSAAGADGSAPAGPDAPPAAGPNNEPQSQLTGDSATARESLPTPPEARPDGQH
jgi:sec-independent protein translocase protein TatB